MTEHIAGFFIVHCEDLDGAIELAFTDAERRFLTRRLSELGARGSGR